MCACLSVCAPLACSAHRSQKMALDTLDLQLRDPWCGVWEPNLSPLQEQQALLTSEPPSQPLSIWFYLCIWISLRVKIAKLFFTYSLVIYVFSFDKYLFNSLDHLLVGLFIFGVWYFVFFHVFWILISCHEQMYIFFFSFYRLQFLSLKFILSF